MTTLLLLALGLVLLCGCYQQMAVQPRYDPLSPSSLFANGQSAQTLVPDTVPRGDVRDDPALFTGKVNGQDVDTFPFPITREVLQRGQDRFNIYCSPCHGTTGQGNGMIVQRGFSPPPTFHSDRLRTAPVGHFFDVITNGFGAMPSYASQVPVRDRWAIIAYIRALQLSENATVNDVPPNVRPTLGPTFTPAPGAGGTPTGAPTP